MEFWFNIIPPELTIVQALGLIAFSYFTSAITVTFGIGGGVMMLMAMASMMPVASVIPVHGAVQMGSNGGRAWIMRGHLNWTIFKYFFLGSVIGAVVAGQLVISLPKDWLRLILGIFVVWIVWAPKLTKRDMNSCYLRHAATWSKDYCIWNTWVRILGVVTTHFGYDCYWFYRHIYRKTYFAPHTREGLCIFV